MFKIFQVCFWTGTIFAVTGFVFGQLFDFLGIDGDIDVDGDFFGLTVFPLKPVTIAAFVTVFGGVGMILLNRGFGVIAAFIIALSVGFAVAFMIFRFIIVPLHKLQYTSAISQSELIGKSAVVKVGIKDNGFGRISYIAESNTYTAPAKSLDGSDIEKGSEVLIAKIDKNIFFVIKK